MREQEKTVYLLADMTSTSYEKEKMSRRGKDKDDNKKKEKL